MAAPKALPYKQYLTPALHRRFTGAAVVILVICYIEAILIGEKTSFLWLWFPIGSTGIRTLLLSVSALSVFVLRVAQLRLGSRDTPSPSATFIRAFFSFSTVQTAAWYLFSAWWFSEVYVWSAPDSADLGWVSLGKSWERRKLNERPIYLRSFYFIFALIQTFIHISYDYDSVALPTTAPTTPANPSEKASNWASSLKALFGIEVEPLLSLFWYDHHQIFTSLSRNIVLRTLCVSIVTPFIYVFFLRTKAWQLSIAIAALVWDVPPSRLSYIPPHYPTLMWMSWISGFFLVLIFEASNVLFTAYVAREPLKKGQPFTAESKDPNGTLLLGLKQKKEIPRTFSMWELSYITAFTSERRKSLFTDIDRPSGPVTAQIFRVCLANIKTIQDRITEYHNPSVAQPIAPQKPVNIDSLPRISTPLQQGDIFAKSPPPATTTERIEYGVDYIAKYLGQSPNPGTFTVPSAASSPARSISSLLPSTPPRKLLTQGSSSSQNDQTVSGAALATLNNYTYTFLRSSFGAPFRHTFARRACTVVLGSPSSMLQLLIFSIRSLTSISVASLTEDPYGKVAKDIPQVIRIYVSTIYLIESFINKGLDVHWTDIYFDETAEAKGRKVPEVDLLVLELKTGLKAVLDGFGRFAGDLGLSEGEMVLAKKLVAGLDEKTKEKEKGDASGTDSIDKGPDKTTTVEMVEVQ